MPTTSAGRPVLLSCRRKSVSRSDFRSGKVSLRSNCSRSQRAANRICRVHRNRGPPEAGSRDAKIAGRNTAGEAERALINRYRIAIDSSVRRSRIIAAERHCFDRRDVRRRAQFSIRQQSIGQNCRAPSCQDIVLPAIRSRPPRGVPIGNPMLDCSAGQSSKRATPPPRGAHRQPTCAATSPRRKRCWPRLPLTERPPSFKPSTRSPRELCHAG